MFQKFAVNSNRVVPHACSLIRVACPHPVIHHAPRLSKVCTSPRPTPSMLLLKDRQVTSPSSRNKAFWKVYWNISRRKNDDDWIYKWNFFMVLAHVRRDITKFNNFHNEEVSASGPDLHFWLFSLGYFSICEPTGIYAMNFQLDSGLLLGTDFRLLTYRKGPIFGAIFFFWWE